jgi:hypothetical protein
MTITPKPGDVGTICDANNCITIPRFQRRYAWTTKNAHQLIMDLAQTMTNPENNRHWIGAAIYKELGPNEKCVIGKKKMNHRCYELIDGQQRFTTIRLWFLALQHHAFDLGQELDLDLNALYLQSPNDVEFQEIVDRKPEVFLRRNNLSEVYVYFRYLIWLGTDSLLSPEHFKLPNLNLKGDTQQEKWHNWLSRPAQVEDGLARSETPNLHDYAQATLRQLEVLYLSVEGDEDPVRIFASLNGNRQELSQFDHLRNYVFSEISKMVEPALRDSIYDNFWHKAEEILEEVPTSKGKSKDDIKNEFLYDYLISIGEGAYDKFNASSTYPSFTRFINHRLGKAKLIDWVKSFPTEAKLWVIQKSAHTFSGSLPNGRTFHLDQRPALWMARFRFASDGPPAPVVLFILRRHFQTDPNDEKYFTKDDLVESLFTLEKILMKTILRGESLTTFRSWVISNLKGINELCKKSLQNKASTYLQEELLKYQSATWDKVKEDYQRSFLSGEKTFYESNSRACFAVLDALAEQISGGANKSLLPLPGIDSKFDPFWIEHIYPQSNEKWLTDIEAWNGNQELMNKYLHSIGNLSLLPSVINKKISNKKLSTKQAEVASKKAHAVNAQVVPSLNDWLTESKWTEIEIQERERRYFDLLQNRWEN